jgi:rubrerythrin
MNYMKNMNCMNPCKSELPKSYKTLDEALKLVKKAVQGEREDELFYDYLICVAPSKEEKDIIRSIRDDERKHNKMFRAMYKYYTGEDIRASKDDCFDKPPSYIHGIKKALFGELSAMERYRIIRAGLPDRYFRDMAFEILTDEMKHADKYNYILNLNLERKMMQHHMHDMCKPMDMNMGMMDMDEDMCKPMHMNMGMMDMMDMGEGMCKPMHMNMGMMDMMDMGEGMCKPMHMNMGIMDMMDMDEDMCKPEHKNMGIMDMMDMDMKYDCSKCKHKSKKKHC